MDIGCYTCILYLEQDHRVMTECSVILRHSSLIISVRSWSGEISPQHTTSEEGSYVQRLLAHHVFNNNWTVTLIILSFSLIQMTIDKVIF